MSTRSVTTVMSRWDDDEYKVHCNVYRHHDGYLEGHGKWLHDFLTGLVVVNGLSGNMPERYANGPGRLAGQMVHDLQVDGHSPDILYSHNVDYWQDYHYVVYVDYGMNGGLVSVGVHYGPRSGNKEEFNGTIDAFGKFIETADK